MGTYSDATKIKKILFGDAVISKVYFGTTPLFSNGCKVTWKYLTAYPDTWTTVEEELEYGATPSRALPNEVVSGNEKKVATAWDNLTPVTADRTITCGYSISYRATSFNGSNCTTDAEAKWYGANEKITWQASTLYWFGNNQLTKETTVVPGENTCSATAVPSYTLTATNASPSYGDLTVVRTASPYARASLTTLLSAAGTATIYQGDTLTGTSTAKPEESGSWGNWETIPVPTVTSTGAAETGNLSIKNNDTQTCTMYYNTSDSVSGATSAGSASAGGSAKASSSSISFGGTYYCFASRTVKRYGTGYHYEAASGNYTGTAEVSGNVAAGFDFTRTEGQVEESQQGYSATTMHTVAQQNTYTVSFSNGTNATWSSTTSITDVPYGASISLTKGSTSGVVKVIYNGTTKTRTAYAFTGGNNPIYPATSYNNLAVSNIPSSGKVTSNLTLSCSSEAVGLKKYGAEVVVTMNQCKRNSSNECLFTTTKKLNTISGFTLFEPALRTTVGPVNSTSATPASSNTGSWIGNITTTQSSDEKNVEQNGYPNYPNTSGFSYLAYMFSLADHYGYGSDTDPKVYLTDANNHYDFISIGSTTAKTFKLKVYSNRSDEFYPATW